MIIPLPARDPEQTRLGQGVRRVREARGYSVERLAGETGIAQLDLMMAEQGRRRLTAIELHAVVMALHLPIGLLFETNADLSGVRPL
jgi:transcriptional regulator with XRE-family HTH domain